MATNVCPNCSQVTLNFDDVPDLICPLCGTVFETKYNNSEAESSIVDVDRD